MGAKSRGEWAEAKKEAGGAPKFFFPRLSAPAPAATAHLPSPATGKAMVGLWAGAGRSLWSILRAAASEHHGKILPPSDMAPTCPVAAAGSGAAIRGSGQKGSWSLGRGAEGAGGGGGGGGGGEAARGPAC